MNFDKIKEFIKIAKDEGVSELKFEKGDEKFHVSLNSKGETVTYSPNINPVGVGFQNQRNESAVVDDGLKKITSPFVGTFYAQSSPDVPAYAKVGDKVNVGQVLCIVEAMKIMNEIESDLAGEIVSICVENENYVEYGQVLFKIKP